MKSISSGKEDGQDMSACTIQTDLNKKAAEKEKMLRKLGELQLQNKDLESQLQQGDEVKQQDHDGLSHTEPSSSFEDPPSSCCTRVSSSVSFIPQSFLLEPGSSDEGSTHLYGRSPNTSFVGGAFHRPPDSPVFGLYCDIEENC